MISRFFHFHYDVSYYIFMSSYLYIIAWFLVSRFLKMGFFYSAIKKYFFPLLCLLTEIRDFYASAILNIAKSFYSDISIISGIYIFATLLSRILATRRWSLTLSWCIRDFRHLFGTLSNTHCFWSPVSPAISSHNDSAYRLDYFALSFIEWFASLRLPLARVECRQRQIVTSHYCCVSAIVIIVILIILMHSYRFH